MRGFIDIHNHIIPGIDDGATDLQETKKMLQTAYNSGTRAIIATPHVKKGCYMTERRLIDEKLELVKSLAKEIDDEFEIFLGCEIFGFRGVSTTLNDKIITLANSKYVLIEFFPKEEYSTIRDVLYEFQSKGYIPILAHVERYENLRKDFERVKDLNEMGVYFQVNASSLVKFKSFKLRSFIKKLISHNLIQFVATDAHDIDNRQAELKECAVYLNKKYGISYMEELLINNPKKILKNKYI